MSCFYRRSLRPYTWNFHCISSITMLLVQLRATIIMTTHIILRGLIRLDYVVFRLLNLTKIYSSICLLLLKLVRYLSKLIVWSSRFLTLDLLIRVVTTQIFERSLGLTTLNKSGGKLKANQPNGAPGKKKTWTVLCRNRINIIIFFG